MQNPDEIILAQQARIEELERDLDALQADNAELVAALESVEWTRLGEMPEGDHCCYCGALKKHGHVTGCKVANVLKRTTLAQALAKLRKP